VLPPARAAPGPERGFLRDADGRLPNVLLITVDTLRADHVAYQGSPYRGLTPTLDRLAAEGTVFLHTTSPAPATRPALAGLLTGSYPGRHAVFTNRDRLPMNGIRTLAGVLRSRGYTTVAFYGNPLLRRESGFARGFDRYESFVGEGLTADAKGADAVTSWLASRPREPWFLWLHLMSPHGPYNSAPPAPSMVAAAADPLPERKLLPSRSNYGLGVLPKYQRLRAALRASEYRRRYREEVFFVDAQIDRVIGALAAARSLDSTLVIVTADHGESLGEHDLLFQHGWLTNEASVQVPLLWRLPGRVAAGHRSRTGASLVDVLPTLGAALDLASFADLPGRDLSAALAGGESDEAPAFSVSAYPNQMTSLRRGDWKVAHTPPPPRPLPRDSWASFYPTEESFALYDLSADPREERDLSADEPERLKALRDELLRWEEGNGLPRGYRAPPPVDAATSERLRALGYAD
jgi:arylsulfatase A-like enzyme